MVLGTKTRMAKRKLEVQEVRKEKQTVASGKHDKRCLANKDHLEKGALTTQLKSLQNKIYQLEKEKNESEILIENLKNQIAEKDAKKQVEVASIECQTEYEFQDIPCKDCIYVASCLEELNWHIENGHEDEDGELTEFAPPSPDNCKICGKRNSNKVDLRIHLKVTHPETVRPCRFFVLGKCDFPESICWFIHTKPSTALSPQTFQEYKYGLCEKVFQQKNDFMHHRKQNHKQFVPKCGDYINGSCRLENNVCWFIHQVTNESPEHESSDMMTRLFKMMEKFTERMEQIENQLYNENL